jgi:transposase
MSRKNRRACDASVKLEVVRMIKERGLSVQNVSESIDIGETAIRRWLTVSDSSSQQHAGLS